MVEACLPNALHLSHVTLVVRTAMLKSAALAELAAVLSPRRVAIVWTAPPPGVPTPALGVRHAQLPRPWRRRRAAPNKSIVPGTLYLCPHPATTAVNRGKQAHFDACGGSHVPRAGAALARRPVRRPHPSGRSRAHARPPMGPQQLEGYFVCQGKSYRVTQALRRMVTFRRRDAFGSCQPRRMHLFSCRNVLMAQDAVIQRRALRTFAAALLPGGLLVLGAGESIGAVSRWFDAVDGARHIYRRRLDRMLTGLGRAPGASDVPEAHSQSRATPPGLAALCAREVANGPSAAACTVGAP